MNIDKTRPNNRLALSVVLCRQGRGFLSFLLGFSVEFWTHNCPYWELSPRGLLRSHVHYAPSCFTTGYDSYKEQHSKKRKLYFQGRSPKMSFTTTSLLNVPSLLSRKRQAVKPAPAPVDMSFSTDLELSFASTVSLNSPPRNSLELAPPSDYGEPMDISPCPAPKAALFKAVTRPRAFTSAARMFGDDVSNQPPPPSLSRGTSGSTQSGSKRTQRSALPFEWLSQDASPSTDIQEQPSQDDDAMDVDHSSFGMVVQPQTHLFPTLPQSAAPTVTAFSNLFYETSSPGAVFESPVQRVHKKRRSLSPERSPGFSDSLSSSPGDLPSSPSDRRLDRVKPSLAGLGMPNNGSKRPRRPVLSALVQPSDNAFRSAFPALEGGEAVDRTRPARRAFSAMIPPTSLADQFSEESSFEGPDGSSPAQAYARRQQVKTLRRCDGTEDFRPLSACLRQESPAKLTGTGLPGFGDNERAGKLLPCHRVSEDGLMRISPQTMNDLLDGVYGDKIQTFQVIDCRFDYEYAGGHIPGAVNLNTPTDVEALLLGNDVSKPQPSVSGDGLVKTVLIFHCEFSAKRAPTFAKHLRAKDRSANHHVYPRIHYPEVYILEGGYCNYFKTSRERCEPSAYVTMDDPEHAASRREDLDQFRKAKFGRHRSYTFGDGGNRISSSGVQAPKRNTAPSGGPSSLFAAGNAARTRRGGAGLMTLTEDSPSRVDDDDTDVDIGDSPCPPPVRTKKGRGPMVRAETYAFC